MCFFIKYIYIYIYIYMYIYVYVYLYIITAKCIKINFVDKQVNCMCHIGFFYFF